MTTRTFATTKIEQVKKERGGIRFAIFDTIEKHGLINGIVNCRGIESMYQNAEGIRMDPDIARLIAVNDMTIFTLCSGHVNQDGTEIPEMTINGIPVEDSEYFWKKINKMSDGQENYVIFHVQMLTTGIDLPSVNSIVILGDKNETDLFQSIMRGCRVDWNNPEKKDYEVYCYVDGETRTYMENFINTIDKIGGPELINAFSNDVLQGETASENNSLFTEILKTKAGYKKVIEDYKKIIDCAQYHNRAERVAALQLQLMTYMSEGNLDAFYQLQAMMRTEIVK